MNGEDMPELRSNIPEATNGIESTIRDQKDLLKTVCGEGKKACACKGMESGNEIRTFKQYQIEARKTAQYPCIGADIIYPTLGLTGEAGEFAEKVKKIFRDKNGMLTTETREELAKELGDVLWYLSALADEIRMPLHQIAERNIAKLKSRQERNKICGDGDNR